MASAAFPSGFSAALAAALGVRQATVSVTFLALLLLPYLAIVPAVWAVNPELLDLRAFRWWGLLAAAALTPMVFAVEYLVHALATWRPGRRLWRSVTVQPFWQTQLSPVAHLLMLAIVVGEELLYRQICFELLSRTPGLSVWTALAGSAILYGLNHLYFGITAVLAKTLTGAILGFLYLFGGRSVWLPIVVHVLHNVSLLALSRGRDG